jgi:RNA polymerase sigma factor (sigma-70 family)
MSDLANLSIHELPGIESQTVHSLTKEQEHKLISEIQSLYREALGELGNAPQVLKTLSHLQEYISGQNASLSVVMNRGDLTPAALHDKFDSLVSQADLLIQNQGDKVSFAKEEGAVIFKQFGFTTAVVDYIGMHYCSLVNSGAISGEAEQLSSAKIESLLGKLQPLRDHLFALEDPLLVTAVRARVPRLLASQGKGVFLDDLLQEARQSLFVALHRFDPSKGCCFHTFADDWIGKAVYDEFYNRSHLIRIPEWVGDVLLKAKRSRHDNESISEQLIQRTENSNLIEAAKRAIAPVYFSSPVAAGDSIETIGDNIPDENSELEELDAELFIRNQKAVLEEIRNNLDGRDYSILAMRNGLNGCEPQDFNSIGDTFGIPAGTARQIHRRALDKALSIAAKYRDKLGPDL